MKYDVEEDGIELGSIVNKENNSGFGSNKRLLVLKSGCLYYYSNVPKAFKGDLKILKSLKDSPKSSIDIAYIHHIKADQKNPTQFEIEFEAKHMMGADEIRKTMANQDYNFAPKNTNELIKWRFTCQTKDLRDRWVSSLNSSIKESIDIMKFMKQMSGEKVDEAPAGRKSTIPWKVGDDEKKREEQQAWRKKLEEDERQRKLEQEKKDHEAKKRQDLEIWERQEKLRKEKELKRGEEERLQKEKREKERFEQGKAEPNKAPVTKDETKQPASSEALQLEYVEHPALVVIPPPSHQAEAKVAEQLPPRTITDEPTRQQVIVPQLHMQKLSRLDPEERFDKSISNQSRQMHRDGAPQAPIESPVREQPANPEGSGRLKFSPYQLASWNSERKQEAASNMSDQQQQDLGQRARSQVGQYYYLTNQLFKGTFKERIQAQLGQRKLIMEFRSRAADFFEQMINELALEPSKRTFLTGQPPKKQLRFENMHFRIGTTSSKQIRIDTSECYYFDSEEQKSLRREFEAYAQAEQSIAKLRREGEQLRVRVPLLCLLEYKGVTGLVFRVNAEEENAAGEDDVQLVSRELKLIGASEGSFSFRRLPSTDNYILYSKSAQGTRRTALTPNLLTEPLSPNRLEALRAGGHSLRMASLMSCHELLLSQPLTHRNKQILSSVEFCIYSKALRKVHRAGQAELDELSFWKLVFNRDATITKMVAGAGCEYIPENQGILLDYIRHYCGVSFEFTDPSDLRTVTRAVARPIAKTTTAHCTQLDDTLSNFAKYIKEGKYPLAREILEFASELSPPKLDARGHVKMLIQLAELEHCEGDIIGSIKCCKKALDQLTPHDPLRFQIYSQLLRNNEDSSEHESLRYFKEAIDLTILNFGCQHSSLVEMYCALAHFLEAKKDQQSASLMYAASLDLAEKICGEDSRQAAAIYVDLSRFHRSNGRLEQARKLLERAGRNYSLAESSRTDGTYAKYLLQNSKLHAAKSNLPLAEEYLLQAMGLLDDIPDAAKRMEAYRAALETCTALGDLAHRADVLSKMFDLGVKSDPMYASFSLEKSFGDCLSKTDTSTQQKLSEAVLSLGVNSSSPEESLLYLSRKRQGYGSLSELIHQIVAGLVSDTSLPVNQAKRSISQVNFAYLRNLVDIDYLLSLLGSRK